MNGAPPAAATPPPAPGLARVLRAAEDMVLDLIPNMYGCVLVVGAVTVCLAAGGGGVGKKPALSKVPAHQNCVGRTNVHTDVYVLLFKLKILMLALALPDWLNKVIRFKGL